MAHKPANDLLAYLFAFAVALTAFYACTALVYEEGGFDFYLVLKPGHEWGWAFGGGEEGAWARRHPGEPSPWWIRGYGARRSANRESHTASAGFGASSTSTSPRCAKKGRMEPGGRPNVSTSRSLNVS